MNHKITHCWTKTIKLVITWKSNGPFHYIHNTLQQSRFSTNLIAILRFKLVLNDCIQYRFLLQEALTVIFTGNLHTLTNYDCYKKQLSHRYYLGIMLVMAKN